MIYNLQHNLFKSLIKLPYVPEIIGKEGKEFIDFCGIKIKSRLGLAAGFDKNCEMTNSLTKLGFGYVVSGTVTLHPREGNKERPNIVKKGNVIYNSLGLPGKGIWNCYNRLPNYVSIWGETKEEFIELYNIVQTKNKIIELNMSCPNIDNYYDYPGLFKDINKIKDKPTFIKIYPYKDGLLSWINNANKYEFDGITIGNSVSTILDGRRFGRTGYFENTLLCVNKIRNYGYKGIINACGGVFNKRQFDELINAGADTVQVFSGFVFRGTKLIREINS